jgi:hypothetical protein
MINRGRPYVEIIIYFEALFNSQHTVTYYVAFSFGVLPATITVNSQYKKLVFVSDESVFGTEMYQACVVRLILHKSFCSKKIPGKFRALSLVLGPFKDVDRTEETERSALPPETITIDSCLQNNNCFL